MRNNYYIVGALLVINLIFFKVLTTIYFFREKVLNSFVCKNCLKIVLKIHEYKYLETSAAELLSFILPKLIEKIMQFANFREVLDTSAYK